MSSDALTPLSSVLTIIKANDDEKLYLIQVGAAASSASNDSTPDADPDDDQEDDTAEVQEEPADNAGEEPAAESEDIISLMMTGILNGNEKYIRYFKGEIMTIYDNSLISSAWAPDDVCKTPRFVQKLNAIRDFIKSEGHPL